MTEPEKEKEKEKEKETEKPEQKPIKTLASVKIDESCVIGDRSLFKYSEIADAAKGFSIKT